MTRWWQRSMYIRVVLLCCRSSMLPWIQSFLWCLTLTQSRLAQLAQRCVLNEWLHSFWRMLNDELVSLCLLCCKVNDSFLTAVHKMEIIHVIQYPVLTTVQSTLHYPDRPVHSDTISASLGSIQPYATINARRLFVHISTTVCSQVLIYIAKWTGAT